MNFEPVKVKLIKKYCQWPAGRVIEVVPHIAAQLVNDRFAEYVKDGAKPTRTKVASASSVKG